MHAGSLLDKQLGMGRRRDEGGGLRRQTSMGMELKIVLGEKGMAGEEEKIAL